MIHWFRLMYPQWTSTHRTQPCSHNCNNNKWSECCAVNALFIALFNVEHPNEFVLKMKEKKWTRIEEWNRNLQQCSSFPSVFFFVAVWFCFFFLFGCIFQESISLLLELVVCIKSVRQNMTFVPFSVIYSALNTTVHALKLYQCDDNTIEKTVRPLKMPCTQAHGVRNSFQHDKNQRWTEHPESISHSNSNQTFSELSTKINILPHPTIFSLF